MESHIIETVYRGHKFRSRQEARWAVFFDQFGIKWQYEKEGYKLGTLGNYLPDFWLPDLHIFCEVKAQKPSDREIAKALALAELSGHDVAVVSLVPQAYGDSENYYGYRCFAGHPCTDDGYYFSKCDVCGTYGYTYSGYIRQCDCGNEKRESHSKLFEKSCLAARCARFEYGKEGN